MRAVRFVPLIVTLVVATGAPAAPVTDDPTHEEILATATAKVARLTLEPGEATPEHTHALAHLAVALADGGLVSIAPDGTETPRPMTEGMLGWVPPGVTHVLRNDGDSTFRAVTVDLVEPQAGARNRCATLVRDSPVDCPGPAAGAAHGAVVPQMETDQVRVGLLTLAPGREHRLAGAARPPLVVALARTEAQARVALEVEGGAGGRGVKRLAAGDAVGGLPDAPLMLLNTGRQPARFLVLEFK